MDNSLPNKKRITYTHALLIIFVILLIDQWSKIYVKTHFYAGEEVMVFGAWCRLHFLENEGMAFGMKLSQTDWGKLILTLFRLVAVTAGFFVLKSLVKKQYSNGAVICGALILAGAMGNLIDSMFYGLIFTESYPLPYHGVVMDNVPLARMVGWGEGYGKFLHGKVVDMFYFPMVDVQLPNWLPLLGGKRFEFFEPVFNFADASISTGILTLLVFQNKLLSKKVPANSAREENN